MSKLYNGAGVVAMPTERMSFEKPPRSGGDDVSTSSNRSRNSSRSNGRSGSRSRDIVQEVYNKMGVNYVRGQSTSLETLLMNNKGLGEDLKETRGSEAPSVTPRNTIRAHDFGSANSKSETKSPSLSRPSRGRLSQQWPPPGPMEEGETVAKSPALSVSSMKSRFNRMSLPAKSPVNGFPKKSVERREIDTIKSEFGGFEDERDTRSVVSSAKSVKERIGMYRASTGGIRRQSYGSNVNKRPPKINIYDTSSVVDSTNRAADSTIEIDQSSFIGLSKNDYPSNNSVSRLSVGDAWLSAIHRSTIPSSANTVSGNTVSKNISIVEIHHNDLSGDDAGSAASSVSGEDFLSASPKRQVDRGLVKGGKRSNANFEHMVEERVQAQIAILNMKFEAEIRRIENQIDQECKVRIESLEKRNEELMDLLTQNGIIPM